MTKGLTHMLAVASRGAAWTWTHPDPPPTHTHVAGRAHHGTPFQRDPPGHRDESCGLSNNLQESRDDGAE